MNTKRITRAGMAVATVMLLTAGCVAPEGTVTQADLDALRDEIAQVRAESEASAAEAKAAAEKAEKIYLQSLRK